MRLIGSYVSGSPLLSTGATGSKNSPPGRVAKAPAAAARRKSRLRRWHVYDALLPRSSAWTPAQRSMASLHGLDPVDVHPGLVWASASYNWHVAAPVKSIEEFQERGNNYARPRSADDVSITADGRRLDTKEKVLEFLEELARERAADSTSGAPLGPYRRGVMGHLFKRISPTSPPDHGLRRGIR